MSDQTPSQASPGNIILILGDQLSPDLPSLKQGNPERDRVLMAEVADEACYVPHHKKKLAFVFAAMRHFADELRENGWSVTYVRLDDSDNSGSLPTELDRMLSETPDCSVLMTEPAEYRLRTALTSWAEQREIDLTLLEDSRFIATHAEFQEWAKGRKQLRMEYFYREMRRKTGLLMQGDEPEGGQWNFDAENRKPAQDDMFMPGPFEVEPDAITKEVLALVADRFSENFGTLEPFWFATTRADALRALDHFVDRALASFGDYQDAMLEGRPFLYHSVLAQYINAGLLNPFEVCRRVERAYYDGDAPLNAVEGYIRQIIGWREYVRGIYWLRMPDYTKQNFLDASRELPDFYWTGETDMACMAAAIGQTRDEAYAHHIQRLMVTGNFAMLAGVDPHQVHEWYLAVYADAYEWVEAPNVIGMSQFADGGLLGSKPYAASGNYINKMSNHCVTCAYDVKKKTGPKACPFNSLYWDFLHRNKEKLRGNPRLGQPYSTWGRMSDERQQEYLDSAATFLKRL
ncbi:cryptochrome/photolyase family protein [Phaeobacter italicus]|uniref:cryptochrome/photolyase family protein n=1 Tax=Phaeobacter italicus TaxID=481446 RepID=UPI001CD782EC|nr:cryptochrome/photolyase family protein [Phaeobacter italicus]MCA0858530.1 cryptochrome/photolyase family protein [Phaeobacter italicus]